MIPVLILAGGKGTRLGSIAADIPKPMVPVLGRPLLEWQFDLAHSHKAPSVTVFAGHKAKVIAEQYDGVDWKGMGIRVITEVTPLGTAGAVLAEYDRLPDEFFILYGDTMTNVDLTRMWGSHTAAGIDATIYVHPNDHPQDSDLVEANEQDSVLAIHGYPHPAGEWRRNLVNAALYIFKRRALTPWAGQAAKCDFAKDLIPGMLRSGTRVHAYRGYDYIKDMGTPERLAKVEEDVRSGVLKLKRSANPRSAVFLDRDGTMIREMNHLKDPSLVTLLDGVPGAIRRLNNHSMPVVVITNQPVIARGEATTELLGSIHGRIDSLLGEGKAFVDEWFHCPHHPDSGFEGEVPELKIQCDCRKPEIGMILRALEKAPILLDDSWLIGDTTTDVMTARRAGLRSVLVRTGYAGCDGKFAVRPDYVFPDLPTAVDFILEDFPNIKLQADIIAAEYSDAPCVIISGHAHSGKSTLASALREAHVKRSRSCEVISLDGFILPPSQRGNSFESRHDLQAASALVNQIAKHRSETVEIEIPHYDRKTGHPLPKYEQLSISPDTLLIIEGVSACRLPELVRADHPFLWVDCEQETREHRFMRDYVWRGFSAEQALTRWNSRLCDEVLVPPSGARIISLHQNPTE